MPYTIWCSIEFFWYGSYCKIWYRGPKFSYVLHCVSYYIHILILAFETELRQGFNGYYFKNDEKMPSSERVIYNTISEYSALKII